MKVVCLKWGDEFSHEYVTRLRDGAAANMGPHEFICFTEDPVDGVDCRPIPEPLETWWGKLSLFKVLDGPVLYFDLDTIIVGRIDDLAAYRGEFACLRDFYRPYGLGSGIMAWNGCRDIWTKWDDIGRPRLAGGDQSWIELMRPNADRLQDLFPGIVSYKADCLNGIPAGTRIIGFHGKPRPHEVNWLDIGE